jgi:transcriptional regulator with XRE-family HTH domain
MAKAPKKKASMLANEFGKRLRSIREERGLTQRELAQRIETQIPQISRYESGASMPNAETLVSIAEVLHVRLDFLLLGEDGNSGDNSPVNDVRLLERLRELEKLDRRFRDTAIAVIDAIVIQGNQEAVNSRLTKSR